MLLRLQALFMFSYINIELFYILYFIFYISNVKTKFVNKYEYHLTKSSYL